MKNIMPLKSADRLHIARTYMNRHFAAPLTLEQGKMDSTSGKQRPPRFLRIHESW